jgi:uncharacterized membrane protein
MTAGFVDDSAPADADAVASNADPQRPAAWRGYLPIGAISAASLAFYLFHAFADQARYLTTGYDLGIFDQAVRAYSHFQAPMAPLKGADYNIFGDHFHPIIAVLAPLYWIWDDPIMLLIAQAVLVAASIPVVYRFTRRRAGHGMSLVIAGAYGLGWPVQALIDFDFHEIAFATPLLALAVDALDRRDDRRLLIWAGLLLLVREDMGAVVFLLAVLRVVQRRRPHWPAAVLAVAGAVAYVLTTTVVIPHFAAGHGFAYGGQFDALGHNLPSALGNIVAHPWHAAKLLVTPSVKVETLSYLLLPLALLPLRSRYALLAVPLLAERFFNSRENLWKPHFHYNALPWLVLVLAMVDGAARFGLFRDSDAARRLRVALTVWLVAVPVLLPFDTYRAHPYAWTKMRTSMALSSAERVRAAQAVVAFLPRNTCVEADNKLVPHLTRRDYVTLPDTQHGKADFIALNLAAKDVGGNPPAPTPAAVLAEAQRLGYTSVFSQSTFVVLRSPGYAGPSAQCDPFGKGKTY